MLVLTRKRDETVQIGDGITITVVRINGNMVRIGIEAPRDVPVHRGEVREAIKRSADDLKPRGHVTDEHLADAGVLKYRSREAAERARNQSNG